MWYTSPEVFSFLFFLFFLSLGVEAASCIAALGTIFMLQRIFALDNFTSSKVAHQHLITKEDNQRLTRMRDSQSVSRLIMKTSFQITISCHIYSYFNLLSYKSERMQTGFFNQLNTTCLRCCLQPITSNHQIQDVWVLNFFNPHVRFW